MEGFQCLCRLIQRHDHALFVVLIGGGGVGSHIQRIQNGDDLFHCMGNTVAKLLVGLAGGALAVVVVLGSHAQQLFLGLCGVLLGHVQLSLDGFHLAGLLVEPAAVLFLVVLRVGSFFCGGLLCGSCLLCRCLRSGGGLLLRFRSGSSLFGFFAHSRSSL